jgi:hypothetical protein
MLLVAGLPGLKVSEAETIADMDADAALMLNQNLDIKLAKQMVEAAGDIPLGVFVKDMSEESVNELAGSGCDFVVFDVKMSALALQEERIGRFLMVEPSLEQGLVRAINSLDVDGVFLNRGEESFITVEHLLICQRFNELLNKPLVVMLPSLVTSAELSNLWQIGIHGMIVPPTQPEEAFTELRGMIDNLPKGTKRRRGKIDVVLPHYGESVAVEEEEEEEI